MEYKHPNFLLLLNDPQLLFWFILQQYSFFFYLILTHINTILQFHLYIPLNLSLPELLMQLLNLPLPVPPPLGQILWSLYSRGV